MSGVKPRKVIMKNVKKWLKRRQYWLSQVHIKNTSKLFNIVGYLKFYIN